jgi:DNA/RNA endonuclease YhcR with UshA esterase domain
MAYSRYILALPVALALVVAACNGDLAPQYEPQGTGSVEGFVFFDADRNGVFDPSAGDYVLPNVRVNVLERGTTQTIANGNGQTGADGRFVIDNLRPGTHSLRVDTASLPAGVRICQNPVPVSVYLGERQFRNVGGRAACIISIAAAEQTRNQTVVISGIVTAAPPQLRSGSDYTYIQDETGGIRIFGPTMAGRGIEIGDRIEVSGVVSVFSGDLQLGGTLTVGSIQKNVFQVVPQNITTGALAQAGLDPEHPLLGTLVRIPNARIENAFGTGSTPPPNGRNAFINSGDGRAQLRFETGVFPGSTAEAQAALNARFPVGRCYDITGVAGAFTGEGQIFPRTLDDIREVPCL